MAPVNSAAAPRPPPPPPPPPPKPQRAPAANTRPGPAGNATARPPSAPTAQSTFNQGFAGRQIGAARSRDTDRGAFNGRGASVTTNTTNRNGQVSTTTQNSHISKAGRDVPGKSRTTTTQAGRQGLQVSNNGQRTLAEGQREIGARQHTASRTSGNTTLEAHARGPSLSLGGSVKGSVGRNGLDLHVKASIDANAGSAGASATHDFKFKAGGHDYTLRVKLAGDVQAGIHGGLKLDVHAGLDGKPQFTVGAEGFAGAQGKLSGDMRLIMDGHEASPVLQGELALNLGAGVGGAAELSAGADHFHAKAFAYAGVGVGAELNGHVNWNEASRAALAKGQVMPWDPRAQWVGPLHQLQFWQKH